MKKVFKRRAFILVAALSIAGMVPAVAGTATTDCKKPYCPGTYCPNPC